MFFVRLRNSLATWLQARNELETNLGQDAVRRDSSEELMDHYFEHFIYFADQAEQDVKKGFGAKMFETRMHDLWDREDS